MSSADTPSSTWPALLPALSITLLISWGSLVYAFAALAQPIQQDLELGAAQVMGAYSAGLAMWGIGTHWVGRIFDRSCPRRIMVSGSLSCALLFALLAQVESVWALYGIWLGLGVAMSLTLYEPAFALVVRLYPLGYRVRIGILTLAGAFASTVFWPLSYALVAWLGWRDTVLCFAAFHLLICAPLHGYALPRLARMGVGGRQAEEMKEEHGRAVSGGKACRVPPHPAPEHAPFLDRATPEGRRAFWGLALSFVTFSLVIAVMSVHLIPILEAQGVEPLLAIGMAALVGPMQAAGRLIELLLGRRISALGMGRLVMLGLPLALCILVSTAGYHVFLYGFVLLFGLCHGLFTNIRATTPGVIFGTHHYAAISGALGAPALVARACGPLLGTFMVTQAGYTPLLFVLLCAALVGALAYWRVSGAAPAV